MVAASHRREIPVEEIYPNQALLTASRNQSRIAAINGLLHDFSNAMMGICALSEFSLNSLDPDNPLKSNLKLISENATKAQNMMRSIAEINRSKPNVHNLADLSQLVPQQEKLLRVVLPGGASLHVDAPNSILPVRIDESSFKQVLLHFALNAGSEQSSLCYIKLSLRRVEAGRTKRDGVFPENFGLPVEAAELSFSDNGGGIAANLVPKIFEPFFTTRGKLRSMGLGLYFAKCFAEDHGGQLGVLNKEGQGATFLLLLPLEDLSEDTV